MIRFNGSKIIHGFLKLIRIAQQVLDIHVREKDGIMEMLPSGLRLFLCVYDAAAKKQNEHQYRRK